MKMGIKKLVDQYSTVNKLLFPNMSNKMRLHYAKFYDVKPINNNMILYETRDGKSIVDSPYAIFLYLAKTPEFNHFQHDHFKVSSLCKVQMLNSTHLEV